MKREILLSQLQPRTQEFFIRYRIKKHYQPSLTVTIPDCLEILLATNAHFKDTSFSGSLTFDHIIDLAEFKLGWDGEEILDIMLFYVEQFIKDRMKRKGSENI